MRTPAESIQRITKMPKLTLTFKGRHIDVFHLKGGETTLGRDPGCSIVIDSLAIAPVHLKFTLDDLECRVENRDPDHSLTINQTTSSSAILNHGDELQVGKHTLVYTEDGVQVGNLDSDPVAESAAEKSAFPSTPSGQTPIGMLQVMNGDNIGRIIPLHRHMTRIGQTGGDCAIIARRDTGYFISHLDGARSPVLNKRPIGEEIRQLHDGDTVQVGATQMQFHT